MRRNRIPPNWIQSQGMPTDQEALKFETSRSAHPVLPRVADPLKIVSRRRCAGPARRSATGGFRYFPHS